MPISLAVAAGLADAGRPRLPPLDRIARIVISRRRGMAADDQPVDQGFVLGAEAIIQRLEVIIPLLLGARAGDDAADER